MTATQDPGSPPADVDLNDAERDLLDASTTGRLVDLRTGDEEADGPANASEWNDDRNVRADFLADLLTGDRPTRSGRLRSVKLRGARITGALDLEARQVLCPLLWQDCYFNEPINLNEAETSTIRLPGCHVPGLDARQLRTNGSVYLEDGFTADGAVILVGAHVDGMLSFSESTLTNNDGFALSAGNITVTQNMNCRKMTAHGEIYLVGAHIHGQLILQGASLSGEPRAISADGIIVNQIISCRNGFSAEGEFRLVCAQINGVLDFSGAKLSNRTGQALEADAITVRQSMFCNEEFTAEGEVNVAGAAIGGQFNLSDAKLSSEHGSALRATDITVSQGIVCSNLTAYGKIDLRGAHINGQAFFSGAKLSNDDGPALDAGGIIIDQDMYCDDGFAAQGEVVLTNARVGTFHDEQDCWPDTIQLRGFTYDNLGNRTVNTYSRLQWLQRHPGRFTPGIYDQLADVYRRSGDDNATRRILVAKQWRRRKPYNPLSWLWWVTVGYGYRTWQAFIWAAALAVAGSLVFGSAYPAHMTALSTHPPRFQSMIYTLDVLLPIGGLGQKSAWQATGGYLDCYWVFAIAGWVLSAAVVAGLTGILKRD